MNLSTTPFLERNTIMPEDYEDGYIWDGVVRPVPAEDFSDFVEVL